MTEPAIKPGIYRHYKGGVYTVISVVRHSETHEEMVLYAGSTGLWVRPISMFLEEINVDGQKIQRFQQMFPAKTE
ncbi:MAG: DUF1653 domain-containing protein [Chamaesiphon sp.]